VRAVGSHPTSRHRLPIHAIESSTVTTNPPHFTDFRMRACGFTGGVYHQQARAMRRRAGAGVLAHPIPHTTPSPRSEAFSRRAAERTGAVGRFCTRRAALLQNTIPFRVGRGERGHVSADSDGAVCGTTIRRWDLGNSGRSWA
jgi:hypothetical protein